MTNAMDIEKLYADEKQYDSKDTSKTVKPMCHIPISSQS